MFLRLIFFLCFCLLIHFVETFQEITLRKCTSNERIGLTVSYSSGNGSGSGSDDAETCTEVYISDILADSVAARDGRLRQGDQILQVRSGNIFLNRPLFIPLAQFSLQQHSIYLYI